MYELFEHTADLGLRVQAADLNTLLAEAAEGLFAAIVENPDSIRTSHSVTVSLTPDEREFLLFDWLKALLYQFDAEHMLFRRFEVNVGDHGLNGTAWGEPLDPERHTLAREVKAITYHELKVEQTADGWLAEVIVDI